MYHSPPRGPSRRRCTTARFTKNFTSKVLRDQAAPVLQGERSRRSVHVGRGRSRRGASRTPPSRRRSYCRGRGEITAGDLADARRTPTRGRRQKTEKFQERTRRSVGSQREDASRATDDRQTAPDDARQTVPHRPSAKTIHRRGVPESAPGLRGPTGGDAAIMRTLFGVGGGVENGTRAGTGDGSGTMMIRGAVNHDAIMSGRVGGPSRGSAAAEADRVARRAQHAAAAIRARARIVQHRRADVDGTPGRGGRAAGYRGRGSRRFGRVGASAGESVSERGRGRDGDGSAAAAGVAGAGGARGGMGSQTLRSGSDSACGRRGGGAGGGGARRDLTAATRADDAEAESLLRDLRLSSRRPEDARRPGWWWTRFRTASTQKHALFRRLLKVAATLERNPPNASGRGRVRPGASPEFHMRTAAAAAGVGKGERCGVARCREVSRGIVRPLQRAKRRRRARR